MSRLTHDEVLAHAASLQIRNQAFIDGRYVDAASGRTFDCINPADGSVIASVAECDAEDVDRAVAAARRAFDDGRWRDQPPRARKETLLRFADLIDANAMELALLETLDMGKPILNSLKVDISLTALSIRWNAEAIDKIYDEVAPTGPDAIGMITREPIGVVGAVVPWNFPLMMASWKLGPALATGNSVVLKPAEQSPLTALRIAELAVEAGLPDGVFNVLPGFGPTAGQALGRHMEVDCIAFTGSGEVGKLFMKYSAESNMKRIWLEAGGKSPNVVFADAPNLDVAAKEAASGIFYNQGEVCSAGSRLIVEESIKDEFLEKVIAASRNMQPGDPLDPASKMGAIVDEQQMNRVLGYIDQGREEGAEVCMGGNRVRQESGGYYIEPTIFDGVTNDMTIAQEEIFGPVLSTVTFRDYDEAIKLANQTTFGLAAAVWTRDITRAHRAARAIRAGSVWINNWDGGDITMPFGGFKQSGNGRDKSLHALDKYVELKAIWINLAE